jgi:hypothetical protein
VSMANAIVVLLNLLEVLKQVWDLSDQDNDGMLSLREFCIALYLMERHRAGTPLPSMLPDSLKYDQTLLQATGLPSTAYNGPSWQQNPGNILLAFRLSYHVMIILQHGTLGCCFSYFSLCWVRITRKGPWCTWVTCGWCAATPATTSALTN